MKFLKNAKTQARVGAAISAVFWLILFGTISYHSLEDWSWIQSFYFTVVTLTTVGYGDLTPTTDDTRLFTAVFILIGVTVVVSSAAYVGQGLIERQGKKREQRNAKRD